MSLISCCPIATGAHFSNIETCPLQFTLTHPVTTSRSQILKPPRKLLQFINEYLKTAQKEAHLSMSQTLRYEDPNRFSFITVRTQRSQLVFANNPMLKEAVLTKLYYISFEDRNKWLTSSLKSTGSTGWLWEQLNRLNQDLRLP